MIIGIPILLVVDGIAVWEMVLDNMAARVTEVVQ